MIRADFTVKFSARRNWERVPIHLSVKELFLVFQQLEGAQPLNEADFLSHPDRSQALRSLIAHAVELPQERLEFMQELVDVGEPQLAFTFLCENLDEFDVPISLSDRETINALAGGLHAEKYARYLDDNPERESD